MTHHELAEAIKRWADANTTLEQQQADLVFASMETMAGLARLMEHALGLRARSHGRAAGRA